LPKTPPHVLT